MYCVLVKISPYNKWVYCVLPHFSQTGVPDNDSLFKKPREVVHKNTRFTGDPFSKALNKSQIQQAAALNAQVINPKISSHLFWTEESTLIKMLKLMTTTRCGWCIMCAVQFKQGKVGPDGKELIPRNSPTVNGYGFERTPSPAPGTCAFKSCLI